MWVVFSYTICSPWTMTGCRRAAAAHAAIGIDLTSEAHQLPLMRGALPKGLTPAGETWCTPAWAGTGQSQIVPPSIWQPARNASASSARPRAASASAVTRAESLVQRWSCPRSFSCAASAASPQMSASPGLLEARSRETKLRRARFVFGCLDCQRALIERPRARKIALVLKQIGEVVEARGRILVLGAEHLLIDRQHPLKERPRPAETAGSAPAPANNGSAPGWSFEASSIASAKVFATVRPS